MCVLRAGAMTLELGATFRSFAEFENEFRQFQENNHVLFVTKSTKTVDVVNARLSDAVERLKPELKYANATFVCKHGGTVRRKAKGIHPNQRTLKLSCPAMVVIAARRSRQLLEITKLNLEHNHEVSSEIYRSYPESQRLLRQEKDLAHILRKARVCADDVVKKLWEETGNKVVVRHNVRCDESASSGNCPLMQEIEQCREMFRAEFTQVNDQNGELEVLLVQTPYMRKVFTSFPEVLVLDTGYRANKLGMPLFIFLVQDGGGNSHIVAYALIASDRPQLITRLFGTFMRENPSAVNTKVVVVDKDFRTVNAIKGAVKCAFQKLPAVQLCEFHFIEAFRSAVRELSESEEEQQQLVTSFSEMVRSPTAEHFEWAKLDFTSCANEGVLKHFNDNWRSTPDRWARHLCDLRFMGANNSTNCVKPHSTMIRNTVNSSDKLHDVLGRLLDIAEDLHRQVRHIVTEGPACNFHIPAMTENVERLCAEVLTPYACSLVSLEVQKAKSQKVEVKEVSPKEYTISGHNVAAHKVSLKHQRCNCSAFLGTGLLCWHFLAVCMKCGMQPDLEKAVGQRWFKSFQLDFLASCEELVSDDPHDAQVLQTSDLLAMDRSQRHDYVMQHLRLLADCLVDCQPDTLQKRLSLLENVKTTWVKADAADAARRRPKVPEQSNIHYVSLLKPQSPAMVPANCIFLSMCENGQEIGCQEVVLSTSGEQPAGDGMSTQSLSTPAKKRVRRAQKRKIDPKDSQPVPFKKLPQRSREKLLLTGITSESVCSRVLNKGSIIEKTEVQVCPELLPSALLDDDVCLQGLREYFTFDAWLLLTLTVAEKKEKCLSVCQHCSKKNDGARRTIRCSQCLERFHRSCVTVAKTYSRRWFCSQCTGVSRCA